MNEDITDIKRNDIEQELEEKIKKFVEIDSLV